MTFRKVYIIRNIPIKNFCGRARFAVFRTVSIVFAKTDISFLFDDSISCHRKSIPQGNIFGEEITVFRISQISLRGIGGTIIESHIMCDNCLYRIFIAQFVDMSTNFIPRFDLTKTLFNLRPIHREFGLIETFCH